jgi:hypothetical protein
LATDDRKTDTLARRNRLLDKKPIRKLKGTQHLLGVEDEQLKNSSGVLVVIVIVTSPHSLGDMPVLPV